MARISVDVNELKKSLKATALNAKTQISDLAKRAQKDLSQKEVLKKIDQIVEIVKSQEFMKNPKVVQITKRIIDLSEQLEKAVTKSASEIVDQVKARMGATSPTKKGEKASTGASKKRASSVKKSKSQDQKTGGDAS